ncbi:hypothetical protein LSTR_LSTR013305 [Laodelphax striatellus]|uniref:Uncharacterized protein n=1 Tax=Laodelphax striatellus TaxID=195883 RepID=A0A482WEE9_LAOST|nr:hypothetical protein LSTR_LSTR013305 [Laodelphax striatellus]
MYNVPNDTRQIPNSTPPLKSCTPCSVKPNIPQNLNFNPSTSPERRAPPNSTTQYKNQINFNPNMINTLNKPDTRRLQNSTQQVKNQLSFNPNMINTFNSPDIRGPQISTQVENLPNFNSNLMPNPNTRRPLQSSTQVGSLPYFNSNVIRNVPDFGRAQNLVPQVKTCTPCTAKNDVIEQNFSPAQDGKANFQGSFHPSQGNLAENWPSNAIVEGNNMNFTKTVGIDSGLNNTVAFKSSDFDELIQAFSSDNQEINQSTKLPNNCGKASFQIKKLKESDFDELMKVLADNHCFETSSECSSSYKAPVTNDMRQTSRVKLDFYEDPNQTDATKTSKFNVGLNRTFSVDEVSKINMEIRNSLNDTRKMGKLSGDCCKDSAQNRTTGNSDYDELIRRFTDEINNKTGQSTPDFNNNTPDKSGKLKGSCNNVSNKETKTSRYDKLIEIFSSRNNDESNRQVTNNEVETENILKLENVNIPEKSDVMKTLKAQQNCVESKVNSVEEILDNVPLTSISQNSGITLSDNKDELLQVFSGKCRSNFNNMTIDDPECQKCPSRKSLQEIRNKKKSRCQKCSSRKSLQDIKNKNKLPCQTCPSRKTLQERANRMVKEAEQVGANLKLKPVSKSTHVISLLNQLAPTPLKGIPPKKEETEEETPLMNEQINCALKKIQEVDSRAADLFLNLIGEESPNRRRQKRLQNCLRKLSVDERRCEKIRQNRPECLNPNIQRSIMNTRRCLQKNAKRKYSCKDSPVC